MKLVEGSERNNKNLWNIFEPYVETGVYTRTFFGALIKNYNRNLIKKPSRNLNRFLMFLGGKPLELFFVRLCVKMSFSLKAFPRYALKLFVHR